MEKLIKNKFRKEVPRSSSILRERILSKRSKTSITEIFQGVSNKQILQPRSRKSLRRLGQIQYCLLMLKAKKY